MRGQRHAPAALYPRERHGTHCTGSWVGPRAGLDRSGKSRLPPEFDPRTVQPVASRYTDYATRPTSTAAVSSLDLCEHGLMMVFCEAKHVAELTPLQCRLCSTDKIIGFILFFLFFFFCSCGMNRLNPLNPVLNPICYLLALLGAHHFLHVSRIRVKSLTLRLLMSYIYIWSTHS